MALSGLPHGTDVAWEPQAGSQSTFLSCPIYECLYEGTRGPGKTDALLMDFAREVGTGLGADWRGILFRRTYKELNDVVAKTNKWFPQIFPGAKFHKVEFTWYFPGGEQLLLRHGRTTDDYWNYHGHAYPWIGWEELTNWPSDGLYRKMMSCSRSSNPAVPKRVRATCNPAGCVRFGEVLTETGWVDIRDFRGGRVVSVGPDGTARLSEATQVVNDYSGRIVRHQDSQSFIEVTEDHRLPHLLTDGSGFRLRPFHDLPGSEAKILSGCSSWEGEDFRFVLPKVKTRRLKLQQPMELSSEDFAVLMGWYLSEGCTVERDRAFNIAQVKHRELLEADLDRLGFTYSRQKTQVTVTSPSWYTYLLQFGKCTEKHIPRELLNAPEPVLRLLLDRLMAGDGTWDRSGSGAGRYPTISRQLQQDVAELCVKLGYRVSLTERLKPDREYEELTVAFRPATPFVMRPERMREEAESFEGPVYCLNVPGDETFFIRQNGHVSLLGNSGHNWVKKRFRLPYMRGIVIRDATDAEGNPEPPRVAIHGDIHENRILLDADPDYIMRLRASARNKAELEAWLHGDWDIVSGGMFDDLWHTKYHVIAPFTVPQSWKVDRAFDWGSSHPFSVGWWAQSDGTTVRRADGSELRTVRGDLFRIAEWYGCSPKEANKGLRMLAVDIAKGIRLREDNLRSRRVILGKVRPGPADAAIWNEENGPSIYSDFQKERIGWEKADKSPGSRKQGWEQMRLRLQASVPPWERPTVDPMSEDASPFPWQREDPGLFVFNTCTNFIDSIPSLSRSEKDPDDIDTDSEDHIADEARYRVRATPVAVRQGHF